MQVPPLRSRARICSRYCPDVRWLLVLITSLGACSSSKSPPPGPRYEVRADKRVELLSIVMRLAGAPEYVRASSAYARDVDAAFAAFEEHPAVIMTMDLRTKRGISHDAPMLLAVHLDDKLQPTNPEEVAAIDGRWTGINLDDYARGLRDFAEASHFDAFFDAHRAAYAAGEAKLRALESPVPFFDKLFGARGRHVVVPAALLGGNNVGVRNGETFYQLLSEPMQWVLVHEMAHSYVNPVFAKHRAELERAGKVLYPIFAETMREQSYTDWTIMLNEAAVRAITVRYFAQAKRDREAATQARSEQRAGFPYIHELAEVLRKYERDAAPKFDGGAMPKLVAFFDALATLYATSPPKMPFIGPFDAVLNGDYVLAPGGLAEYTNKLPFFAGKPIVKTLDETAGKSIVAYGSPSTNQLVGQAAAWGLWKIEATGIELGGKRFAGDHLVLIACWFRRDEPSRGIAVYAAADENDLVGINHGIAHGQNDWLVARKTATGFEIVEAGDWPVENNALVPFAP